MADLTKNQKKEWAQLLITREGLTQKEAAHKVGISIPTMNKWFNDGKWDTLRKSMMITREEQLRMLYEQLSELNGAIKKRNEGERYANSKEADSISKLATAIRTLESEANIADIVEVTKRILNWLRPVNPDKAREFGAVCDEFIRELLKRS